MPEEQVTVGIEPIPSIKEIGRSASIGKLVGALAKAQLAYKPIFKGVENTFYTTDKKKAMYADLSAIILATQKALAENGLVIIQSPVVKPETKEAGVRSLLAHSSDEWTEVEVLLPATAKIKIYEGTGGNFKWGEKFDAQTCGIAITYTRRYSYQSQAGVAAEEDDDANSIGEAAGGSKEAAQSVAARKTAEMKAKKETTQNTAALGNGVPSALEGHPSEVYGLIQKSKEAFRKDDTDKKRPYRIIEMMDAQDRPITLYCFHDTEYDESRLFTMLDFAATGKGMPARFEVGYEKNYVHIKRPIAIGPVFFDADGVPMLDNSRE